MSIAGPRGTNDLLPGEQFGWRNVARWQYVEGQLRQICDRYGYAELRPPVFEYTELFARGVGATTDVVQKEMFTLQPRGDDGNQTLTLRPEFTAGMVRAYLESGLFGGTQPTKVWVHGPAFRAERPQKGRYRQFHQWDVEIFGVQDPAADAEVIEIGLELARELGLGHLNVHLNSLGCPKCRPPYRDALKAHFGPRISEFCPDCQRRLDHNPLRIIDCKVDAHHPLQSTVPLMVEHLCNECALHWTALQSHLRALEISYAINPRIVRGLDYYTKTVFEVLHPDLGAQNTLWGGGRYDGLIEALGGKPTPGVGFALGLERMLLVLDQLGTPLPAEPRTDCFVIALGAAARASALGLVRQLRRRGLKADFDLLGRSLKAQMKYADKIRARYAAIIGENELAQGVVTLRNMDSASQAKVLLNAAALAAAITAAGGRS